LRLEIESRVTAGEEKLEALIAEDRFVHGVLGGGRCLEQACLLGEGPLTADTVDGAPPCGGDEPCGGAGRRPFARPTLGGDGERLLRGFLGEVKVAEEADQRSEDASPLVVEDPLEDG
jgi:hypothetical protein